MTHPLFVLPAHNEHDCLEQVLEELHELVDRSYPGSEILVVDDGSTDQTEQLMPVLAARLGVRWVRLPERLGIGAATIAGLRFAQEHQLSPVVRLDADGQHDPAYVRPLLEALEECDAASGSRFLCHLTSGPIKQGARRFSQYVLATVLTRLTGRRITDPTSGFWAFGRRAIALLAHEHPSGYPEPELHLLLHRTGMHTCEVAVRMRDRIAGQSTLGLRAGVPFAARVLLAAFIVPLRRFKPAGELSAGEQAPALEPTVSEAALGAASKVSSR